MIFEEQVSRKPDRYPWASEYIEAMHAGFWTDKEFSFSSDKQDFHVRMSQEEKQILVRTLSAISQIEIAVKKFWVRLGDNLPHPSIVDLGIVMGASEVIHNRAYNRLLEELGIHDIFEENLKLDIIRGRVNYLQKYNQRIYSTNKKQYVYAIILFTLFVENVSLFSQFYIILWMERYKNVLKDTAQQVNYTTTEERLHASIGTRIINTIREEHPELFDSELEERVLHEAEEAVKAESLIIDWIMGDFSGHKISAGLLKEYVKSRTNDGLEAVGFRTAFAVDGQAKKDFRWMDEDSIGDTSADFFFQRNTSYVKTVTIDEDDLI